jgi:hypothetical protein
MSDVDTLFMKTALEIFDVDIPSWMKKDMTRDVREFQSILAELLMDEQC